MLTGRRVVLAVTGGVAAYKAAYLARRLVESGATVRCVMTPASLRFLGAQTMAAICGTRPQLDMFGDSEVSPHTTLAQWAECVVVAPTTAATVSRLAHGLSNDIVTATALAAKCSVIVAPAMHAEMWQHPATQRNIATLRSDGVVIVGPEAGSLSNGDIGEGRMSDPETIRDLVQEVLETNILADWKVLVSAGGTRESIDPVRYIGNRSSGKMGNALAEQAVLAGAQVLLVTTVEPPTHPRILVHRVETAEEMAAAVWHNASRMDAAILAAAVADFRPKAPENGKLRRVDGPPLLELEPTPDILAGVAAMEDRPFLVGFAAEVGSKQGAIDKAKRKCVDLLVVNDVVSPGSGFGTDTNQVALVTPDGEIAEWDLMSKQNVAKRLWAEIAQRHRPRNVR